MKQHGKLIVGILLASLLYPEPSSAQNYLKIVRTEDRVESFDLSNHEIRFSSSNRLEVHGRNGNIFTFDVPTIKEIRFEEQIATSAPISWVEQEKLICVTEGNMLRIEGSTDKNRHEKIQLYNLSGAIVKELFQPLQTPISIENLTEGIYIIRIKGENLKFIRK